MGKLITSPGIAKKVSKNSDAIAKVDAGLAIIVSGDSCTQAVPAGGYAYIKNNTHGLAEGLYKNKSSISFPTSGGTANSTVFEAVSEGGLNALNSNLTNVDHKNVFTYVVALNKTQTSAGNWTDGGITFPVSPGDRVTMDIIATGTGKMSRSITGSSGHVYASDDTNISDYAHGKRFAAFTVLSGDSSITISSYANSAITVRTAVINVISKY